MKNEVKIQGILTSCKKFSDKVGSIQVKVQTANPQGESYENSFFLTVFKANLEAVARVPIGSMITCEGKLKNSSYEKDGAKIWKLEILMNSFTHQAEVGIPTRLAKMSPQEYQTRANSDFRDEMESIPF